MTLRPTASDWSVPRLRSKVRPHRHPTAFLGGVLSVIMKKRCSSAILAVVVVSVLSGCAVSSSVTAVPLEGQVASQVETDERECASSAKQYKNQQTDAYRACMIARGYRVYVALDVANSVLQQDVNQVQRHDMTAVLNDLQSCAKAADDAQAWNARSVAEKTGTVMGGLVGGAMAAGVIDRAEAAYGNCLNQRGYAARRWVPASR